MTTNPSGTESSSPARSLRRRPALRAALLFLNFFLIILAYYLVKPASRSLFLEYGHAADLPYLWTASAALLVVLMAPYQRLVKRHSRIRIVLGTGALVVVLLVLFRVLLLRPSLPVAVGFYLFVDVFSVVLVEQFWSLTNSVYRNSDGRRWYGLIASGGLLGGLVGGTAASSLVSRTPLVTADLLLVAAGLVGLLMWMSLRLARRGVYRETSHYTSVPLAAADTMAEGWRALCANRYLMALAVMLLLSQMCEPIVEFQFMRQVERVYTDAEARTAFLSGFLGLLNAVALAVNLLMTPLIHRRLGAIAGLLVQPVLLGFAAMTSMLHYGLWTTAGMKISDRGLAYSINRASRELLYIPADPVTIYRAKAWIDMVGYRVFKIAGNVVILLLTQWLPWTVRDAGLSWVVAGLCAGWLLAAWSIREDYRRLRLGLPCETADIGLLARNGSSGNL